MISLTDQRYPPLVFDALARVDDWQSKLCQKSYTTAQTVHARRLNSALVQAVPDRLTYMGYGGRGGWLSRPCLFPAHHQHGYVNHSFGFNVQSGYGNCFRCGSILLKDICTQLGIQLADYGGPFVYSERNRA